MPAATASHHPAEPLSALLSQLLVAFTIDFDNAFELQVPHRTTRHGATPNTPWLVSMAVWLQLLRFVPDRGIAVSDLRRQTSLPRNTFAMLLTRCSKWWGYLTVSGDLVRPTHPGGLAALVAWRPLTATIEARWRRRFGAPAIDRLSDSLEALIRQLGDLSDSLPMLGFDLLTSAPTPKTRRQLPPSSLTPDPATLSLASLLAKALFAFAADFEADSRLSLGLAANILAIVPPDQALPVRDLPILSGLSDEAVALCLRRLKEQGLAFLEPSPTGRHKLLRLTSAGDAARATSLRLMLEVEQSWSARFGAATINTLRATLEALAGPQLLDAIAPPPGCWRASLPLRQQLPRFPMILHRGGFPDGA